MLREWWRGDDLGPARAAGLTAETLLGALLAARRHRPDLPDAYMRSCLAQGVAETYLREARQLIAAARPATYTGR